ncbi:MAG: protoporphyrinogen oxidase [Colwellia sp.]|jgi:protoporphyrinogen oxidase
MKKFKHTIVGGGIAGLLASILIKKQNPDDSVCLIETEDKCGGLLKSIKSSQGYEFDYGTHILGETGIKELDEILMPTMLSNNWSTLPILKSGNVVNGYYHKMSQLLYARALPESVLEKATYQLLSADHKKAMRADNLQEYCYDMYGETFTEKLFKPLMKKLINKKLQDIHPSALQLFGYNRLIIGPAQMMKTLKKTPLLDNILGFESYNEGVSSLNNYYPKHGKGIGLWVDDLVAKATALNVKFLLNTKINSICYNKNKINTLTLSNHEYPRIEVENLIWTAPLFPLIKLAGLDFTSKYKPSFSRVILHNFVFDQPFDTHNFHVYCNDPNMKSFRITLYSNIAEAGEINGPNRCTVEVLSNDKLNNDITNSEILQMENNILAELKTMGIITLSTSTLYRSTVITNDGFPAFTNGFVNELSRQKNCVNKNIENIQLLGKASANNFFMADVLVEVFNTYNCQN